MTMPGGPETRGWAAKRRRIKANTIDKKKKKKSMINDILLYLQTRVQHNCNLRDFIQQLLRADAEILSQTLG